MKIRFTKREQMLFDARVTELKNRAAGMYDAMLDRDWSRNSFSSRTDMVGRVHKAWQERWTCKMVQREGDGGCSTILDRFP